MFNERFYITHVNTVSSHDTHTVIIYDQFLTLLKTQRAIPNTFFGYVKKL